MRESGWVLSSDLIIYATGCRDLPLCFTALRKQEQIERRWMMCLVEGNNEANFYRTLDPRVSLSLFNLIIMLHGNIRRKIDSYMLISGIYLNYRI